MIAPSERSKPCYNMEIMTQIPARAEFPAEMYTDGQLRVNFDITTYDEHPKTLRRPWMSLTEATIDYLYHTKERLKAEMKEKSA